MTTVGFLIVTMVLVLAVSLLVGFALRGRVQRNLYAGTGLPEWNQTAKTLSWSDRWHLARANGRGRAARPELASMGAQRARAALAALERYSASESLRWILRLGVLFAVAQLALNVWLLMDEETSSWWNVFSLVLWPVAIVLFLVDPWYRRRQSSKLRQSIEANEALAGQHAR